VLKVDVAEKVSTDFRRPVFKFNVAESDVETQYILFRTTLALFAVFVHLFLIFGYDYPL